MGSIETAERRQYLSFSLAGNDYAVGILQVKEILQYETVTRIPSVPPSIRGVINLRGVVVPVIDMAVKFGLPATIATKRSCILIVEAALGGDERTVVGLMADSVREVLELGSGEIEPPPSFGAQTKIDFLVGMGKTGKGFVLMLDLDRVVSAGERELAAQLGQGEREVPVEGASAVAMPPVAPRSEAAPAAG